MPPPPPYRQITGSARGIGAAGIPGAVREDEAADDRACAWVYAPNALPITVEDALPPRVGGGDQHRKRGRAVSAHCWDARQIGSL